MKLKCTACGYDENNWDSCEFVGVFVPGKSFVTTYGEMCGLFGCPRCNTVQFVTDVEYINKRKEEYKQFIKERK